MRGKGKEPFPKLVLHHDDEALPADVSDGLKEPKEKRCGYAVGEVSHALARSCRERGKESHKIRLKDILSYENDICRIPEVFLRLGKEEGIHLKTHNPSCLLRKESRECSLAHPNLKDKVLGRKRPSLNNALENLSVYEEMLPEFAPSHLYVSLFSSAARWSGKK